ncbi:MAG: tetratricopeptide repeat protein [Bryobacteraceae bacterium]|nr:tetratricopeptide repeat protein [Bryobacteraceae bacterium]
MSRPVSLIALAMMAAGCSSNKPAATSGAAYADAKTCAACHAAHAASYRHTGMGRSFFRATPANMTEDFTKGARFFHKPSNRYYELSRRDGRYFLKRHQIGFDGRETNILEKEIHYVMGSGNHARSYIHRTPENRLVELPVGWYAENGGVFGMSPGYDRPGHLDFRRNISFDCMFCHNGYPAVAAGASAASHEPLFPGELPEGIDCQRCHGPGAAHVEVAQQAKPDTAAVKAAIVNPARLSPERQLEVCMQCHLETTSFALPNSMVRIGRGAFSYRPGEPLENFVLHFDHAPGTGHDDKFEIVNSVYRLRKSACFLNSGGKLLCTTCHNPHDAPRGEKAVRHYAAACRRCHDMQSRAKAHPGGGDCAGCHMPKRRTEDVVHAVMTDHLIQRRPGANLTAPRAERREIEGRTSYQGEVVLYYPPGPPSNREVALHLALAQVVQKSNLDAGIPALEAAIEKDKPARPEYYFELAQAHLGRNRRDRAIEWYRRALARDPNFVPALASLGSALRREGRLPEALQTLENAVRLAPRNPTARHELGEALRESGRTAEAIAAFAEAIRLDPNFADAHNSLGGVRGEEASFRQAITLHPDYAEAHANLASLVGSKGDAAQAEFHFRQAIAINPDFPSARFNLAFLLASRKQYAEAQVHVEHAIRVNPGFAQAREMLGNLYAIRGAWGEAAAQYREALKTAPGFGRAKLGLGTALVASGDAAGARRYLSEAAQDADPAVRQEAVDLLTRLSGR